MNISGHTQPFAVLGHPIGHTLSPVMHNAAFAALGMDALYLAFDVAPEKLTGVLAAMQDMGFGGVNLTVPLKEIAFRSLAKLDESAQLLGAVNTVQFTPAGLVGHNTDGQGFLKAFEEAFGTTPAGKSVFVLGAGGAGRAVALMCAGNGARSLTLADVDAARCRKVAQEVETQFLVNDVRTAATPAEQIHAAREADVIVQATPIGMKTGDPTPLAAEAFRAGHLVYDLVYMYPETAIMKAARPAGAKTANGLSMLLHQGARAFHIWTGREPAVAVMRAALEKAVYGQRSS